MSARKERGGRRKSDPGTVPLRSSSDKTAIAAELPWGVSKIVPLSGLSFAMPSGEFAAQSVLSDLFALIDRKATAVVDDEPLEKLLNKTLQRGEDAYMDNLARTLHALSELCLPSVLEALIAWYEHQDVSLMAKINNEKTEKDEKIRVTKRLLAINYMFCLVLIEILPQVEFHISSCEHHVKYMLDLAFNQVAYKDPSQMGCNHTNGLVVSETFAEVIGVLSHTHFLHIHKQFFGKLSELKKDSSHASTQNTIALLMAMKFVKIKTNQVNDFEQGIRFLDELGTHMLETKDKDVKHAVAGLLVEILLPVAAQIKRETNIPALIAFVSRLYAPTNEMANKKQHKMAAYPLLTCLLCVSQRAFFLANWVPFLHSTLANLKNRDSRLSRVALESLYRLLWVYIIRNNCDGNQNTRTRLASICASLFPKGNRSVTPRDAPLNIFVKIIHFIAQQKLDFAFKEVIFDLLGCGRSTRTLCPERMNIGIRALMVIADGLQQKDEPPAMPKSMGPLASGTMQRQKKKQYITRPLTVDVARSIGLDQYYIPCRKAFDSILRVLDAQVGKPLMLTALQGRGKEPEELLGGDTKPKLDLFRTCVAAIPRLLPEPMTHTELIDIVVRLTVHADEELRNMSTQTLQNLLAEFPEWRESVVNTLVALIANQLTDTYPTIVDLSLRQLMQIVCTWKTVAAAERKRQDEQMHSTLPAHTPISPPHSLSSAPPLHVLNYATVLHNVEGLALVMLCQIRGPPRKIAVQLLKEVKQIFGILGIDNHDTPMITVLDEATPYVVRKYIEHVPLYERQSWNQDFATICDKVAAIEPDNCLVNSDKGNEYMQWDPWACALSGYCERRLLVTQCPTAVAAAWPALFTRLNAVNAVVDPSNPQNESRASLLRGSRSKASSVCGDAIGHDSCLSMWQKYVLLCCALVPPPLQHMSATSAASRSFSPTSSMMESSSDVLRSVSSSLRGVAARAGGGSASATAGGTPVGTVQAGVQQLFTKAVGMLRWEHHTDMRDNVALGVGSMNPLAFESFLDELHQRGLLREAQEKKPDTNLRRRRRKDLLRLQLIRVLEVACFRGLLQGGSGVIDAQGHLNPLILDFIEAMRVNLETDQDRDRAVETSLRLHLAKLVALIIESVPPHARANLMADERKQSLFYLFIGWCSRSIAGDKNKHRESEVGSYVERQAVLAMTRILCCGPIFEPSKSIGEDGYLYGWLEKLVASSNQTMCDEVEEVLAWMMELNESSALLDWLILQCYQQTEPTVAARCFRALVRVFSRRRDFPCEFVALFVLCQNFAADKSVADQAVQMLELLRKHFLDQCCHSAPSLSQSPLRPPVSALPSLPSLAHSMPLDQHTVCRQLATAYPQLTITIFSEVCSRVEWARPHAQASLLSLLLPWLENLELVDTVAGEDACEGPRGWGSEEATQLLLNNLLSLTVTLPAQHETAIREVWRAVAVAFPANLPAILNYLYVMTTLSHEVLLPYTKRMCVMLAGCAGGARLSALLIDQLIGGGGVEKERQLQLERSPLPPYYRWRDESAERARESEDRSRLGSEGVTTVAVEDADESALDGVRGLPMPPYGGHYCQLSAHLPPSTQPIQQFTRSQVALLLLCDVIRACPGADWADATPRMMHAAVLGLDCVRPVVCRHARQLLINACMLYAEEGSKAAAAAVLMTNQMPCVSVQLLPGESELASVGGREDRTASTRSGMGQHRQKNSSGGAESPTWREVRQAEYRHSLLHSNALFSSHHDLLMAIVFCLSENMDRPLWANEDATARQWRVPSAQQLTCLVRHVAELLLPRQPLIPVVWTQIAMRMALSLPHRHAAGRCFQIASALCQPPGPWIPTLLSRLVETAGETHEDTQAYVTDLLLCLLASTPHLSPVGVAEAVTCASPTHARSTSYTPALLRQSVASQHRIADRKDARLSLLVSTAAASAADDVDRWPAAALLRSKSAEALKCDESGDEESARAHLLAISVALLDSALDNEFLLALHLLDKILETAGETVEACLLRLEKTIAGLDWKGFTSVVGMVVRGAVIPGAYETCVQVLVRLCGALPTAGGGVQGGETAFALLVCAVLPMLLAGWDQPNELCRQAAGAIEKYCMNAVSRDETVAAADHPLTHLSTMMRQYCARLFARDRFQWAKCVQKYLLDGHPAAKPQQMLILLAEMLERSVPAVHVYALHMQFLLLSHLAERTEAKGGEAAEGETVCMNAQVLRAVCRQVAGAHWREASRVLRTAVEQWHNDCRAHPSAKCVPSFQLDRSVLRGASLSVTSQGGQGASPPSPRKDTGGTGGSGSGAGAHRRQPPPHVRVRERLVALLSASGLRVGLPSAQSVVFSQSELGSSAASSTERMCSSHASVSLPDPSSITDSFPRVFKEFDFLEAEHDSVSETADSCFGWLSTMRAGPRSEGRGDEGMEEEDSVGSSDGGGGSSGRRSRTSRGQSRTSGSTDRTPYASEDEDDLVEEDELLEDLHEDQEEEMFISEERAESRASDDDDETDTTSVRRGAGGSQSARTDGDGTDAERMDVLSQSDGHSLRVGERRGSNRERALLASDGSQSGLMLRSIPNTAVETASVEGSSFYCRSEMSAEYSVTCRLPPIRVQCAHHITSGGQEALWTQAVAELTEDDEGEMTAHATLLITQIYRSCCASASSLFRDTSPVLSSRTLARALDHAHSTLSAAADCPFLFVTAQFLRGCSVMQRLKLSLFELREHFETFNERKEQAIRMLNSVKSAYKLSALGGSSSSLSIASETELARVLHKLFFQLMLMSDSMCDMVRTVRESQNAQDFSLSPAVLCLQRELLQCTADAVGGSPGGGANGRDIAADSLPLLIANKNYAQALQAVRQLRWSLGGEFGCCEQSDVDVLLLQFCRSHPLRAWALAGAPAESLPRQSQRLREANADLAAAVRKAQCEPQRASTASSLAGSFAKLSQYDERQ